MQSWWNERDVRMGLIRRRFHSSPRSKSHKGIYHKCKTSCITPRNHQRSTVSSPKLCPTSPIPPWPLPKSETCFGFIFCHFLPRSLSTFTITLNTAWPRTLPLAYSETSSLSSQQQAGLGLKMSKTPRSHPAPIFQVERKTFANPDVFEYRGIPPMERHKSRPEESERSRFKFKLELGCGYRKGHDVLGLGLGVRLRLSGKWGSDLDWLNFIRRCKWEWGQDYGLRLVLVFATRIRVRRVGIFEG